jgi:hypothetical protein
MDMTVWEKEKNVCEILEKVLKFEKFNYDSFLKLHKCGDNIDNLDPHVGQ